MKMNRLSRMWLFQASFILAALEHFCGSRKMTAEYLGITTRTLGNWLREIEALGYDKAPPSHPEQVAYYRQVLENARASWQNSPASFAALSVESPKQEPPLSGCLHSEQASER